MSSNTNTLFWVITGAVIVLSLFLLINSQNNNLFSINNTFSSVIDSDGNINNELINNLESKNNIIKDTNSNEEELDNNESNGDEDQNDTNELTEEEIEILKHQEFMKNSKYDYCKEPIINDSRFKVEYAFLNGNQFSYYLTNISDEDITDLWIDHDVYNCETNKVEKSCAVSFDIFKAGQTGRYTCSGGSFSGEKFYAIFDFGG